MTDTKTNEGTALATLQEIRLPDPVKIGAEMRDTFRTMYTRIEEKIADLDPDMSVKKNREAARSLAYDIAKTKTGLDDAAAKACAGAKAIIDAVNEERRDLRAELDILRDRAREPLTTWEENEKARLARVMDARNSLRNVALINSAGNSEEISEAIERTAEMEITPALYGEDHTEITALHLDAMHALENLKAAAETREAEARELEQLRREKAERERQEQERREQEAAAEAARVAEEERKQREAEEAERAEKERQRIETEAKEQAAREAKEAIEKAEREKEEALQRERDAEAQRIHDAEQAKKREIEAEERRQREAKEAQEREAAAAEKAEQDAKRREQEAADRERARIAREKQEEDEAARQRAADLEHRKRINMQVLMAIVAAAEITDDQGKFLIQAIVKGQIPHVTLTY